VALTVNKINNSNYCSMPAYWLHCLVHITCCEIDSPDIFTLVYFQTDQDIEWKFVRSKLYMEYIRQGSTLPVPFNIVPSLKSFHRLLIRPLTWCPNTAVNSRRTGVTARLPDHSGSTLSNATMTSTVGSIFTSVTSEVTIATSLLCALTSHY